MFIPRSENTTDQQHNSGVDPTDDGGGRLIFPVLKTLKLEDSLFVLFCFENTKSLISPGKIHLKVWAINKYPKSESHNKALLYITV